MPHTKILSPKKILHVQSDALRECRRYRLAAALEHVFGPLVVRVQAMLDLLFKIPERHVQARRKIKTVRLGRDKNARWRDGLDVNGEFWLANLLVTFDMHL